MVRARSVRRLLTGVAACVALTACDAGSVGQQVTTPDETAAATIAVVTSGDTALDRGIVAAAGAVAHAHRYQVSAYLAARVDVAEQVRLLGLALSRHPRAVIVDVLDYAALLPYLRAAHDAEVPVVLLQVPRDLRNPDFVATFAAPDQRVVDEQTASAVVRILRGTERPDVALLASSASPRTAGASASGVKAALRAMAPDVRVISRAVDPSGAAGRSLRTLTQTQVAAVVALDAVVVPALRAALAAAGAGRPRVVVTVADAASATLAAESLADVVVGTDPCQLGTAAMSAAVAAAEHAVLDVPPSVTVRVRTMTKDEIALVRC